jgi:hypothetical protein
VLAPVLAPPTTHEHATPPVERALLPGPTPPVARDGGDVLSNYGGTSVKTFTGQLKAVVDAKLGLPPGEAPILVPMTDAPLFAAPSRDLNFSGSTGQLEYFLPPRKQADQLVDIYWSSMLPLIPCLDKPHFNRSYQALFEGTLIDAEERVFVSCLHVIFALATQLQESMPQGPRETASKKFFDQAWSLLRPETAIWEPGSLGVLECLLVMSQYLQCTNSLHLTWMTVGSAVRIAQGLGLHLPEAVTSSLDSNERLRKRRVWQACIFMDRYSGDFTRDRF